MGKEFELQSGQINFKKLDDSGYACVIIKNGEFLNLRDELKEMLLAAINAPPRAETSVVEDMF